MRKEQDQGSCGAEALEMQREFCGMLTGASSSAAGQMMGGFALVAYPAQYGVSGVMTPWTIPARRGTATCGG